MAERRLNIRTIKMFELMILTLIVRLSASQSQVYMSLDRGYRGISVHVDEDLQQESCTEIIRKIKDMFSAGSKVLHGATQFTNAPVHFGQVTLVLPHSWSDRDCNVTVTKPTGNTLYKHSDLLVTSSSSDMVTSTVRGGQCGEPGHQIKLPVDQLLDNSRRKVLGNILVSEWSKYRYGVFAETGVSGSSLYPNYYYHHGNVYPTGPSNTVLTGSWRYDNNTVGCDPTQTRDTCHYHVEGPNSGVTCSLNTQPELESVTGWCDDTTMSGPGVQAVLCHGASVRQVIQEHPDFASSSSSSSGDTEDGDDNLAPVLLPQLRFNVVRRPQPKYVLVIETSARMRSTWQWVRKAIVNLIRYEVPDMSHVGIVTYNSRAVVTHGLTLVTSDTASRQRLSDSVPDTSNKLSDTELGCIRCGVRMAMEQVLRNREDGGHVILISASGSVSSLDMDALTEYIKYYNIRLSSVVLRSSGQVSSHYQSLASMSGGVARLVTVSHDSVWTLAKMTHSLLSSIRVDSVPSARIPEIIHQLSGHHTSVKEGQHWTSEGQFVVDSFLGVDTTWGVLVRDDENHHIKSVTFTDHKGNIYGPFTKMSSMFDDINLKTINFPVGMRPPFDTDAMIGHVWRYSVSWYRDPALLDNIIIVRSRPRDVKRKLDIASWTNYGYTGHTSPVVLYVQVSVDGLGVVGADVRLSVHHLDNNGDHQSLATNITLLDDGVADPDLTVEDGVYSGYISPYLLSSGSYQLQLTVTDNGQPDGSYREPTATFIPSTGYFKHQSCVGPNDVIHCSFTGSFIRHVEGPTINVDSGSHASPGPRRITDLAAEYLDSSHQVEVSWTIPDSLAEIRSYTLSYSDNVDTVIRGLETRDVVITRDSIAGHDGYVTQVLPAPDNVSGVVYFIIRAEDSSGAWSKLSNIVYLNITRDAGHVSDTLLGADGEYNYTLLGVILGIITVFSLLTILAVSVWLHRRRTPGKLRSLNGFTNKVSSGVNVVIDKSESRGIDTRHVHIPNINNTQPSSTSFANNITPTYWSASQLLADHEHRKRDNHSHHHLHHGHHYHQYYPVHHQTSHYEDHDSDILEDNNNDHNTSDQSSSTIVMLNTSVSSSNTGTGSVRKKNITQV